MNDLEARLLAVELRLDALVNQNSVNRVRRSLAQRKVFGAVLKRVPSHYYSLPLSGRAQILNASSESQLCKTIVLENLAWEEEVSAAEQDLSTNPRYLALVVQYEAKIDVDALESKVQSLRPAENRLARKRFRFQLAPESVSDELTGFIHNAVTPFGMKTPIPVVVCQRVLDCRPPFIFLGGGEVDMKLGLATVDLLRGTGASVLGTVSRPRALGDGGEDL